MDLSYRKHAADLIRFACRNRTDGRGFDDPVYKAVVEGRQDRALEAARRWDIAQPENRKGTRPVPFSSCGELPHWYLYRLGVRLDWINRDEHDGWHFLGADNNITTLTCKPFGANALGTRPPLDALFQAGDVLIVGITSGSTVHATCVLEHDPGIGYLLTGDYGQPGGKLNDASLVEVRNGKLYRGKRSIDSWLRLDKVIDAAAAAGKLEEIETAHEYAKRFQHVTLPPEPHATEREMNAVRGED